MSIIGNFLWLILGGFILAIFWTIIGCFLCLTIVGIPFGIQCFKIGAFVLFPFGKSIRENSKSSSIVMNILWLIFFGWELALVSLILGFLLYITIIGIPFAKQYFKLARISLMPFGVVIV